MDHLDVAALEGRWVRLEPLRLEHIDALLTAANEDRAHYGYATVPDTVNILKLNLIIVVL